MAKKRKLAPAKDSAVSADLDAYRRHRGMSPQGRPVLLVSVLEAVKPSPQPHVLFARVAEAISTSLADGCQVELSDGVEPPLSVLARRDGRTFDASPDPASVVEAPFRIPSRGGQPSYAGILTLWWNDRPATDSDRIIAELLVRHVTGLVDRQRLMDRAGASEARAAGAAMEAIASRQVNLAIGIIMGRDRCSAARAEAALTDLAEERVAELYTVAAETVRSADLCSDAAAAEGDAPDHDTSNLRVLDRGEAVDDGSQWP